MPSREAGASSVSTLPRILRAGYSLIFRTIVPCARAHVKPIGKVRSFFHLRIRFAVRLPHRLKFEHSGLASRKIQHECRLCKRFAQRFPCFCKDAHRDMHFLRFRHTKVECVPCAQWRMTGILSKLYPIPPAQAKPCALLLRSQRSEIRLLPGPTTCLPTPACQKGQKKSQERQTGMPPFGHDNTST